MNLLLCSCPIAPNPSSSATPLTNQAEASSVQATSPAGPVLSIDSQPSLSTDGGASDTEMLDLTLTADESESQHNTVASAEDSDAGDVTNSMPDHDEADQSAGPNVRSTAEAMSTCTSGLLSLSLGNIVRPAETCTSMSQGRLILIVGCGVTGLAVANACIDHPRRNGARIMLVEEADTFAPGAPSKSGGFLSSGRYWHKNDDIQILAERSCLLHKQLADQHGGDVQWGYRSINVESISIVPIQEMETNENRVRSGSTLRLECQKSKITPTSATRPKLSLEGYVLSFSSDSSPAKGSTSFSPPALLTSPETQMDELYRLLCSPLGADT
ncbi:hypothetical protein CF319_g9537 [Tilletia indica]|nr:hypothetical protein CF319_g9537 [Tilletia indica]